MKIHHLLLCVLLGLLVPISLTAETSFFRTFTKSWKASGKTEFMQGRVSAAVLDSLDALYEKSPHQYLFYERGEELFVLVSCTFDLYKVNGTLLEKQYLYFNRGYNCGANVFAKDGQHYLLGGHGFWMSQMDLLFFDEINGSWEWVKTKDQPLDYYSNYVYQTSKGIVALFGGYYNPRTAAEGLESQGYFLDWETKSWKKLKVRIEGVDLADFVAKGGAYFIETQDYILLATTNGAPNLGWNILEKESGRLFYFQSRNVDMGLSLYLEVIGNRLYYQAPSGEEKILDLDAIKAKSKQVGEVGLLSTAEASEGLELFPLYGLLGLGLGGMLLWWFLSQRKKASPVVPKEEVPLATNFSPIDLLLPFSGQLLTTETLDQLLGIDQQANFDSKRMKRARLINEINEQYLAQVGKELIERDKKPEDRRYVYYRIQS